MYVLGTPTAHIPAALAETIPARLSSITRQLYSVKVGIASCCDEGQIVDGDAYVGSQCGQRKLVTLRVGLALFGIFGRDNRRDLIEPAQLPQGVFDLRAQCTRANRHRPSCSDRP